MTTDMWAFESAAQQDGFHLIAGIDEAGHHGDVGREKVVSERRTFFCRLSQDPPDRLADEEFFFFDHLRGESRKEVEVTSPGAKMNIGSMTAFSATIPPFRSIGVRVSPAPE